LVEADGWQHPAELLDPDGSRGISYRELVCLAEARAGVPFHAQWHDGEQLVSAGMAGRRLRRAPG